MDLSDPAIIAQVVANQAEYEFRLAIIKGFFYGSAVLLMVTVLLILLEDFFSDQ